MENITSETSKQKFLCTHCCKRVAGGTYINNVFYCPMCTSIINKNNRTTINVDNITVENPDYWNPNDIIKKLNESFGLNKSACDGCSKNPKNGGDGICHCILGSMQITC